MQAVIIAAGESSRFWPLNNKHKSQFSLLGRPILYWTLKGLAENGVKDIVIVQSAKSSLSEMMKKENDLNIKLRFVVQKEPLGTGNALWQTRELMKGSFLVVWPNKVNSGTLVKQVKEAAEKEHADVVLVGASSAEVADYGVIRFDGNGKPVEIIENPSKGEEPSNTRLLGLRYITPDFFTYYEQLGAHHEADYVDATNQMIKEKRTALVQTNHEEPTLKYPWDAFPLLDALMNSSNFANSIDKTAKIGKNVVIEGKVMIGRNAVIKDGTMLRGPIYIGDNCEIGYHNVLRGPLSMEHDVKTGAFMELKHSIIQQGTHFHSGYAGDSIIGERCRFAAGFITANRRFDRQPVRTIVKGVKTETRLEAFGIVVGNGSIFGILASSMPGVMVGSGCQIGPGVMLSKNVADGEGLMKKE
ncbi:MAG: hypothetical protein A3E07_03740 [Candidatus Wildermuthbacteria bacterium RIFCSPHIGHO2_12_FULL_45_9]|nr:MAG: hypothetical protein A3E07_03740 [Candidatus Wildermuthbacteria bacterium RIFCSPHIGHO2_12_FULL_45_9]